MLIRDKQKEEYKMAHKGNKSQIFVRVTALVLAGLMLLSVVGTCIYYLIAR